MIFNFDPKIITKRLKDPSVFHLPPSSDFAKHFVEGLLSRFEPGVLSSNPELLGHLKILTSTKTLAKRIEEILQLMDFIILPKIVQLEELSDFFYEASVKNIEEGKGQSRFPVISNLERLLLLESLIKETQEEEFAKMTKAAYFDLATSLGSLIDELNINSVTIKDLEKVTEGELPKHLQLNLNLMRRVIVLYKKALLERELIDHCSKQILDVNNLINHWETKPYIMPLLIAGSTGSQKSTAKLMHAISKLPQGLVVLPGLDTHLTDRSWKSLEPDHPQYGFFSLAKTWTQPNKIIRAPCWFEDKTIDHLTSSAEIRSQFFSLLMRPAPVTDEWRTEGKFILNNLSSALNDVSLIEAENSRLEASAISVSIKEALNEGLTVALISPSKKIARRVTAELRRWKIIPINSSGISLAATDLGLFLRQGALVIKSGFDFNYVISLIKNQICGGGYVLHQVNVVKLQQAPQWPTMSFLDLADGKWLNEQDDEFLNWYNWLSKVFADSMAALEIDFLSNIVNVHKEFSQSLIKGYCPEQDGLEFPKEFSSCWESDRGLAVLSVLNQLSDVSPEMGKFDFWVYKKILESLLSETDYHPISEDENSSVFIWGTLESRTQHADLFILAGLNEGIWPGSYKDDSWLNRPMRSAIGIDLLERKIGLSAHDFQQATMAKKLILSRSLRQDNMPSVSSRWLLRLENLLVGLGDGGIKYLTDIRSRGQALLKLAGELYSSVLLTNALPVEVKRRALRPAPIPPLIARPNRLSVTEIDTLIRNPYSIYAKRILNLRKIQNFQHTSDPRNKGNLVHITMEKFIGEHIDELPDINISCNALKEKFDSILDNALIPIDVKSIWKAQFGMRTRSIILYELQRRLVGKPIALEVYGKYTINLSMGNVFIITAKADRIDKSTDGFIVYDYKTGQVSKKDLETNSPQLDIEALMLMSGSFVDIPKGQVSGLSLVGLGSSPQQHIKAVKVADLDEWHSGLIQIIKRMKMELSAFPPRLFIDKKSTFSDDYEHLSRYGEWGDNEPVNDLLLGLSPEHVDK